MRTLTLLTSCVPKEEAQRYERNEQIIKNSTLTKVCRDGGSVVRDYEGNAWYGTNLIDLKPVDPSVNLTSLCQ